MTDPTATEGKSGTPKPKSGRKLYLKLHFGILTSFFKTYAHSWMKGNNQGTPLSTSLFLNRLNFLWDLSQQTQEKNPSLSRHLLLCFQKLAKKHEVELSEKVKGRYCTFCGNIFSPFITADYKVTTKRRKFFKEKSCKLVNPNSSNKFNKACVLSVFCKICGRVSYYVTKSKSVRARSGSELNNRSNLDSSTLLEAKDKSCVVRKQRQLSTPELKILYNVKNVKNRLSLPALNQPLQNSKKKKNSIRRSLKTLLNRQASREPSPKCSLAEFLSSL
ncbi:uncharacterized protein LOC135144372 [Zophobas morio]|uniref:uncharacterized protein LOC135144372 n=1 Tax=Zophobas morio TaxID=2755281 RepID=UPI0030830385